MPRFDLRVLEPDPDIRRVLVDVLEAALDAAEPSRAVAKAVERRGDRLVVAGSEFDTTGRVIVLAVGKAAPSMATGLLGHLDGLDVAGLVVGPIGSAPVPGLEHLVGAHPTPNHQSLEAGIRMQAWAESATEDDLVIVLVSGGTSAMAEVPVTGVTIEFIAEYTEALMAAGAPIHDLNAVRTACSQIKGGGLAAAVAPAQLVTLAMSDVIGSEPAVIGSGPTVPVADVGPPATEVLERYGLDPIEVAPRPVAPASPFAVVLDGSTVARAAADRAVALGIDAIVVSEPLLGEARIAGDDLARRTMDSEMVVLWGETTVTVHGDGRGGRNQELALAAALSLADSPGRLLAALGTDGVDGPTSAAGAIVDGGSVDRALRSDVDAVESLRGNDSFHALEASGDLLTCGPTGTNVGDLVVVWDTNRWQSDRRRGI